MHTSVPISCLSGLLVGVIYAIVFKMQTKSLIEGFINFDHNANKVKMIAKHLVALVGRFFVAGVLIFALNLTGIIDLQVCCIFVVVGFLVSSLIHTKRML